MLDKENLHHAYVIEAEISSGLSYVREFVTEELGVSLHGNLDLFERIYDGFGIDDAREVKDFLLERAIGEYKIFILGIPSMTAPSANALLKSLEEPPERTHFFIIVPNSKRLLDTLLSRVVLIKLKENKKGIKNDLKIKTQDDVKNILNLYEKEKISKTEIIYYFKQQILEYKKSPKADSEKIKKTIKALDYMSDQSASLKVLMEYIILTLYGL